MGLYWFRAQHPQSPEEGLRRRHLCPSQHPTQALGRNTAQAEASREEARLAFRPLHSDIIRSYGSLHLDRRPNRQP